MPENIRMMIFIDGENIVFRFQEMMEKKGLTHRDDIRHIKDIFVWSTSIPIIKWENNYLVIRAYYYTSASGDTDTLNKIINKIKQVPIVEPTYVAGSETTLYPVIFKKQRGHNKTKGVDIRLTTDILVHTYQNNFDVAYLFTGDGDFIPVIEEVIRRGKRVYIAGFSEGLNSDLKKAADKYKSLDGAFFTNLPSEDTNDWYIS